MGNWLEIPLTQCSLLVEHNFISCHNTKKIDANLSFVVEPNNLLDQLNCIVSVGNTLLN